tara:strand:+ start:115128 stop:115286 length:159 start_codon:yes stop_codon:yes gene_type:complete
MASDHAMIFPEPPANVIDRGAVSIGFITDYSHGLFQNGLEISDISIVWHFSN